MFRLICVRALYSLQPAFTQKSLNLHNKLLERQGFNISSGGNYNETELFTLKLGIRVWIPPVPLISDLLLGNKCHQWALKLLSNCKHPLGG